MTFDEDFKEIYEDEEITPCSYKGGKECLELSTDIPRASIAKHMLSKRLVKEAIEDIETYVPRDGSFPMKKLMLVFAEKKKELGLDEVQR